MKLAILGALALLPLGACNTTNATSVDSFITTLSNTNCHVTGSFSATVGAVNPGSGATLTTMIDCPNGGAPNTKAPAPVVLVPPAPTITP